MSVTNKISQLHGELSAIDKRVKVAEARCRQMKEKYEPWIKETSDALEAAIAEWYDARHRLLANAFLSGVINRDVVDALRPEHDAAKDCNDDDLSNTGYCTRCTLLAILRNTGLVGDYTVTMIANRKG